MILLLLSAAQGPSECCMAVSLASKVMLREAEGRGLEVALLEQEIGSEKDTFKSVLFKLDGKDSVEFANLWNGTLQWVCQSPFRAKHKRKNWFFTGSYTEVEPESSCKELTNSGIQFETCRSSGPGGQHANKTSSAVWATHIGSGIRIKVQSERSQHANKRLARALIEHKLQVQKEQKRASDKSERRMQHHSIERGNAKRVFKGLDFLEI